MPYNRFLELLEHKQIVNDPKFPLRLVVEEGRPTQTIRGAYYAARGRQCAGAAGPVSDDDLSEFYHRSAGETGCRQGADRDSDGVECPRRRPLIGFVPIALFLLILYFLFRQQIRMAGKGALNFGKSKARMLARDKNKITFKDVAGVEEAKDEVQELVEFLRDPKKFQKLGGRIPKGVLMVGPPGHRQNAARARHRRRSGRAVLLHQRLGLRRNVRRRRREPRARHV